MTYPSAKPGQLKVIKPNHYCASNACAAFVLGVAVGLAAYQQLAAPSEDAVMIPAALVHVGQYLCKDFGGMSDLARAGDEHYSFRCRELAEFPKVQITQRKR